MPAASRRPEVRRAQLNVAACAGSEPTCAMDPLAGARFAGSPLVTKNSYSAGGIGFAWILGQSSHLIPSDA